VFTLISTCAAIGGTIGGAVTTLTSGSAITGGAIGTLVGAGVGVVTGLAEFVSEDAFA
jgi:hypothetical protein